MKRIPLVLLALFMLTSFVKAQDATIHTFAPLPYSYDALEPFIDKATMEIHYEKHSKAYYTNFMNAAKGSDMEQMPLADIFKQINRFPVVVRNNAGGYWNHEFFWRCMKQAGGGEPKGELANAIVASFGSFDSFKKEFTEAAMKRFGSGWAWLSVDNTGKLFISSTANQDNPMMETENKQGTPILGLDVWEHAYYLKYQNKRAEYISAFWNVVNWEFIESNYSGAKAK